MAVDTPTKRSSALFVRTRCRRFLPVPDGTISVADRAHLAGVYYEVAAASVADETARHTLYGTSLQRHVLHATATTRHTLNATAETRHILRGATP